MKQTPVQTLVSAVALAGAGEAAAQEAPPGDGTAPGDGPVIVGESRDQWEALTLESLNAAVEFSWREMADRLTQSGQSAQTDRETLARTSLELAGRMFIGHKNLMDVNARVTFGLEDVRLSSDTTHIKSHDAQTFDEFDVSMLILGNGPVPVTVYTRRDRTTIDREFGGSITSLTTETGIDARFESEWAPTTVRYFVQNSEQSDPGQQFDYSHAQETLALHTNLVVGEGHRLEGDATLDRIREEQASAFQNDYARTDLQLNDTITFGEKPRNELRSFLRYFDQGGLADQRSVRLDEQLLLRHSERLESRLNVSAEEQVHAGVAQRLARGEASVRHRLYESLISSASAGGQRLEIPGEFTSDEWFGTGMLEYTKHVPYGRVNASTGVSYSMQQNTERGAALSVFDESHVYNDPLPIVLNRRNIVAGSIVVTAIGGFPTYVEGVDYTVDLFPDRAELRVVVGQGIANGQSVLVDYDVGPEGASRIGTTGTSLSFRYTITEGSLEGLSVFVQYRMTDHSLDTDAPALIVLDDSSDLAVGAEYARGGLTARMEQVLHESTLNPYDSWRARANYDLRLSVDSTISFEATHERTDYSSPANAVALSRAGVKWTERLGARLELVARFVYRDESNTLSGDSRGFEESIGVKWGRGRTSGYASFRNAVLDGTGSTTATQRLEFGVRREF